MKLNIFMYLFNKRFEDLEEHKNSLASDGKKVVKEKTEKNTKSTKKDDELDLPKTKE